MFEDKVDPYVEGGYSSVVNPEQLRQSMSSQKKHTVKESKGQTMSKQQEFQEKKKLKEELKVKREVKRALELKKTITPSCDEGAEVVLKEGELFKFWPGNKKQQYIDKWVQITQSRFRYYKDRVASIKFPDKP
jgi:hypothetical protein